MNDRSPYLLSEPALVSFSGGRTSGYMLWHILQAQGGKLPKDVRVAFMNTGKEREETLVFVKECGERWGVEIVWLEYDRIEMWADDVRQVARIVDFNSASRKGSLSKGSSAAEAICPMSSRVFVLWKMKVRTAKRWMMSQGV